MPYFKEDENKLHFLESADDSHLLPKGCVQISDSEAIAILSPAVAQVKAVRIAAINAHAAKLLAELSASYPGGEVQSWPQQTREAEALTADPQAPSPLLTAIATERGLSVTELAIRVRTKEDAYAVASGKIIGRRQALEDAVNAVDLAAPTAADQLAAIQWPEASP